MILWIEFILIAILFGSVFCLEQNPIVLMDRIEPYIPETEAISDDVDAQVIDIWEEYTITAYCPCKKCSGEWGKMSACGEILIEGYSCASVHKFGTVVEFSTGETYIVQDRMAKWVVEKYNGKIIDIFFDDHESVKKWGKRKILVKIIPV